MYIYIYVYIYIYIYIYKYIYIYIYIYRPIEALFGKDEFFTIYSLHIVIRI